MTRSRLKPHRDGWATAQTPRFVGGPQHSDHTLPPAQRQREAERLRAEVEAHIANGGAVEIIAMPVPRTGHA